MPAISTATAWTRIGRLRNNGLTELANSSASAEAKKGLSTGLQDEITEEIETLLGHQAAQDLDFEAWRSRPGGRLCGWLRERWNNG
jgi:hypothetical protein